ncbi:protein YgfX [Enterovibrio sp. 27052020O]|uniref:protein YgfX n=1 Tax=Enterovibrio sp. 27052020O TaxID=3241166 RepID=UPI003890C93F
MHITAANCVSTRLQRSRWLRWGLFALYTSLVALLFAASVLPLEAKTLLLVFLLSDLRHRLKHVGSITGDMQLHSSGLCRYHGTDYDVARIYLFSRHLIVLDLERHQHRLRLPLAADAFTYDSFRHVSRICLVLKS